MAAREDLPPPVQRWNELVAAARMRCAVCGAPWHEAGERWRLVATGDEAEPQHVLLCPSCAA